MHEVGRGGDKARHTIQIGGVEKLPIFVLYEMDSHTHAYTSPPPPVRMNRLPLSKNNKTSCFKVHELFSVAEQNLRVT